MSELPGRADMLRPTNFGSFVPISDVRTLFSDLVGLPNQGRRQCDPESRRCLEVYSQFKASRLLHREFTWLGTFEDFSNISSRSAVHVRETGAIG